MSTTKGKRRTKGKSRTVDTTALATVGSRGHKTYAPEFKEVVIMYAFKHSIAEASDYFDLPRNTISKWCNDVQVTNQKLAKRHVATANPYRGTQYTLDRRMRLSDKLFAEVEHTLEMTKLSHGYVPADVLHKLVTSFRDLTDKRRLEEGAHTALVQAVQEPEEIFNEGEARVVEFRKRAALPSGS